MSETSPDRVSDKGSVYAELVRLDLLSLCKDQCECILILARTIVDAIDLLNHGDSAAALGCLRSAAARADASKFCRHRGTQPQPAVSASQCHPGMDTVWDGLAQYLHGVRGEI